MEQTIGIKVKIKNPIKLGSKNAYAVKRFLTFLLIIIVAENQPPPYQKFKNPLNLDLNGLEDFSSSLIYSEVPEHVLPYFQDPHRLTLHPA